jgi:hypothetical protein
VGVTGDILYCVDDFEHIFKSEKIGKSEEVAVMEAISKIHSFARSVMWRRRLLALQDTLALGLLTGGFISAALIFYIRWKAIQTPVWIVALVIFSAVFAALLTRWSMSHSSENDAGFLIDDTLKLDDRFATSQALISKEQTAGEVEQALIEDAANRIADAKPAAIAPYQMKKFYALSAVALIAFISAMMVPQKVLPGGEEIVQAQADIQAAGEQLEKTSTEIEKFVPPDTVTANLAKEQAELGRSLRRSSDTRADALKKLSSLEDRIRQRHDEIKSTRADEIVALAQKRMGAAIAQMGNRNIQQSASEKEQAGNNQSATNSSPTDKPIDSKKSPSETADGKTANTQAANTRTAKTDSKNSKSDKGKTNQSDAAIANQNPAGKNAEKQQAETTAKANPSEQKTPGEKTGQSQIAGNPKSDGEKNPTSQKSDANQSQNGKGDKNQQPQVNKEALPEIPEIGKVQPPDNDQTKTEQEAKNAEQEKQEDKEQEQNKDAANPLATTIAQQTTKALSDQLLKKAEELKAGKMSAEDIKKLALSAAQLAKDLAPIAQSKEFQKSLEELAKQVNPQQLEQIARELMKDEKLQRELRAAAKLLWENRQVKDMVAGLTKTGAEIEADMRQQRGENPDNQPPNSLSKQQSEPIALSGKANGQQKGSTGQGAQQQGSGGQGTQSTRLESERKLAGQGREAKIAGQMQNRQGGDYVYSGARPGAGAARIPYSSAYPQYRRQAERSVERSQVPKHMRSMIRNYFDAINPNGKN